MSLTKQVLLPTGFTVEYWRVSDITIHPIEKTVNINLQGFKSMADYDLGAEPAANRGFLLSQAEFLGLSVPDVVPTAKLWLQLADKIVAEVSPELAGAVEDPNDVI